MVHMILGEEVMKYRNKLQVERGGLYGRPREWVRADQVEVDRAMHTAFCQMTGSDGTIPSAAIRDIRRHRQRPWRCLKRRTDEAIEAGVDVETVIAPLLVLVEYARQRCLRRDGQWPNRAA